MVTNDTVTLTQDCPYRKVCTDNGVRCDTCAYSPKRSYYIPVEPYYPWYPYIPNQPYIPWTFYPWTVTYTIAPDTQSSDTHYQTT